MSFSNQIVEEISDVWTKATNHIFTEQLGDDVLSDEAWSKYLIQDYAFVEALTSLVGFAVGKAPAMYQKKKLTKFLEILTGAEDDFFKDAFAKARVPESDWFNAHNSEVTTGFKTLFSQACLGGYPEILSVLLPVEWVYLSWATNKKSKNPRKIYLDWIELHNNEEFEQFIIFLQTELNESVGDLLGTEKTNLISLFKKACELEILFFDHCLV